MHNSKSRDVMYATTISKNPTKHIKAVAKIAKQISSEFSINFDKLAIEYNSSDSIFFINVAISNDSENACNEFIECLSDAISDHFYDSARLEIHETIHA